MLASTGTGESRYREVISCLNCGSTDRRDLFLKEGYQLVRCQACELVYVSNPPTQEELARFYSFASDYHAELATSQKLREQFLERARTYLRFLMRYAQRGRLLDVGCSAGFFMKVARDAGWNVTGLEYSPDSAALGRHLYELEIHTGTLTNHSLAEKSFHVATLWDVIEHLSDPLPAMESVFRLLTPGGYVAISTPNVDGLYPKASYLPAKILNYWTHVEPPAHLCQFSIRTLASLLSRAGFDIVGRTTRRIPLNYSFGELRYLIRNPRRLAYAALFTPFALVGPQVGRGDEVVMIARKPGDSSHALK